MPNLIQRLRDSAADYRRYMTPFREIFPGRSVARHVELLTEAADEIETLKRNLHAKCEVNDHDWQICLDAANANAAEARADAARLVRQLFETREQRDEARESSAANGAEAERAREYEVKMRLEAARALTENAELRKALEASHRELANARNYWANQGPHDHVVISLAGYNKLVTERDEALAKFAACDFRQPVDTHVSL